MYCFWHILINKIAIQELNRTTQLQVTMVELYATTTVVVTFAIVVHIMPLW